MAQNRITIPQGFCLEYVERFCATHQIEDVGAAVMLLIGDHARLIGVEGVKIAKTETLTKTSLERIIPTNQNPANLLAGLL